MNNFKVNDQISADYHVHNLLELQWGVAIKKNTAFHWQSVIHEIDGMQKVAMLMFEDNESSRELYDLLQFAWSIALHHLVHSNGIPKEN